MQLIDWLIVVIPMAFVIWIAFYVRKYIRGVADYLVAGRLAGRYLLTIGDMAAGIGLIVLLFRVEGANRSGIALSFYGGALGWVILTVLSLTGFCSYRFRQSKALSNGQFLEMRYSRKIRIIASILRIFADMLTYSILPAFSAKFFIYFLGIPNQITILSMAIPTFPLLVGLILFLALVVALPGGRIAIFVTDSIQGFFTYPICIAILAYIIFTFSWNGHIIPVLGVRRTNRKWREFCKYGVV